MPDILVRGMEMPVQCASCPFGDLVRVENGEYVAWCKVGETTVDPWGRPESCPLVEVPRNDDITELNIPHDDNAWEDTMEDLGAAETLCCQTEDLPDIWQTRVIRTICKILYRHLKREAKAMQRQRRHADG